MSYLEQSKLGVLLHSGMEADLKENYFIQIILEPWKKIFKFFVALSEPLPEDNWTEKNNLDGHGDGFTGFVHQVVIDNYLSKHENPEDIEVYFCGPPLMNQAIERMAEDFGVPPENVRFDDFGG